jgi:hypothetical protein
MTSHCSVEGRGCPLSRLAFTSVLRANRTTLRVSACPSRTGPTNSCGFCGHRLDARSEPRAFESPIQRSACRFRSGTARTPSRPAGVAGRWRCDVGGGPTTWHRVGTYLKRSRSLNPQTRSVDHLPRCFTAHGAALWDQRIQANLRIGYGQNGPAICDAHPDLIDTRQQLTRRRLCGVFIEIGHQ